MPTPVIASAVQIIQSATRELVVMSSPCDSFEGRIRDICRGYDDAGNPVLTPARCAAYRRRWGITLLSDEALALSTPTKIERPRIEPTKYLGDHIEAALSSVGITKQVVEKFLGEPCGCTERQEKFNQLDKWARAVALGAVGNAKGFLEKIFRGETKMPTGN